MVRYSIIGANKQQVQSAGGTDIKELSSVGIIFAELSESMVVLLKSYGAKVKKVGEVKADTFQVSPPNPTTSRPTGCGFIMWTKAGVNPLCVCTVNPAGLTFTAR